MGSKPKYIKELEALGLNSDEISKLVEFRKADKNTFKEMMTQDLGEGPNGEKVSRGDLFKQMLSHPQHEEMLIAASKQNNGNFTGFSKKIGGINNNTPSPAQQAATQDTDIKSANNTQTSTISSNNASDSKQAGVPQTPNTDNVSQSPKANPSRKDVSKANSELKYGKRADSFSDAKNDLQNKVKERAARRQEAKDYKTNMKAGRTGESVSAHLKASQGIDISVGAHGTGVAQKTAAVSAMQKQVTFGKDLSGKDVNLTERQAQTLYDEAFHRDGSQRNNRSLNENRSGVTGVLDNAGNKGLQWIAAIGGSNAKAWNTQIGGRTIDYISRDAKAARGEFTMRAGANGYGFGWSGNRVASGGAMLGQGLTHGMGLMGEGLMNSLGIVSKQQKIMWKTGNPLQKAFAAAGPVLGAGFLVSTMLEGGDMYDALAFNVAGAGAMAGFHMGKSFAGAASSGAARMWGGAGTTFGAAKAYAAGDIVNGKTMTKAGIAGGKARLAMQGIGGIAGGVAGFAAISGATWAIKDMSAADSVIAQGARKYTSLASSASTMQNNNTLTMRQRALQQLSQSSMNDRAMVLGAESAILRSL